MTLEMFKAAYKTDRNPVNGTVGGSLGSSLFVVNTDAELGTANPTDPWAAYAGVSTNHGNIRPFAIAPDFYQIDLMAIWSDALIPITVAPVVRVFGRVPRWSMVHFWPEDDDPTNFGDVGAQSEGKDFWIPLPASGASVAPATLDITPVCSYLRNPTNGDTFAVGLPTTFPTRGCDAGIVLIDTAGDLDETSSSGSEIIANKMMIGARLIG